MFGLDEATINAIKGVLKKYPQVTEARIFGSRALGTQRPNSDVDIVLYGKLEDKIVAILKFDLEQLSTPYTYDVVAYQTIEHPQLKDHIDRVGKTFVKLP